MIRETLISNSFQLAILSVINCKYQGPALEHQTLINTVPVSILYLHLALHVCRIADGVDDNLVTSTSKSC